MWWRPLAFLPYGEQELLFFMAYGALARGRFGVVAGARDEPFEITGARAGGEPSGAHRDRCAAARDTAGGPGRFSNTGHGLRMLEDEDLLQRSSDGVDHERWSAHSLRLREEWWEGQFHAEAKQALATARALDDEGASAFMMRAAILLPTSLRSPGHRCSRESCVGAVSSRVASALSSASCLEF